MGDLGLIRVFNPLKLDSLTIWNVFFYFFGTYLLWETDEKVDLGNNRRPNEQPPDFIRPSPHIVPKAVLQAQ